MRRTQRPVVVPGQFQPDSAAYPGRQRAAIERRPNYQRAARQSLTSAIRGEQELPVNHQHQRRFDALRTGNVAARVDTLLTEMVRKPLDEPLRSRAIYWLGNTPETTRKNALFSEIARDTKEGSDARRAAMSALSMSRSAGTLPLLQNLFETLPGRDLKQRALNGIGRNDNVDAATSYLIKVAESDQDVEIRKAAIASLGRVSGQKSLAALVNTIDCDGQVEVQKQAVIAVGRRPKDEAVPILIRTARNHPRMEVRKQAIKVLGQTGDERAVAFFGELLSK